MKNAIEVEVELAIRERRDWGKEEELIEDKET